MGSLEVGSFVVVLSVRGGWWGRLSVAEREGVVAARRAGLTFGAAAELVGVSLSSAKRAGRGVVGDALGMGSRCGVRDVSSARLGWKDREEISRGLCEGESFTSIGARIGFHQSTVSREVNMNGGRDGYRAWLGDVRAEEQAKRPQRTKLELNEELAAEVVEGLVKQWSPQQISERLRVDFPKRSEMRVCPETIYTELYVQARGGLKSELKKHLRSQRLQRRPQSRAAKSERDNVEWVAEMVPIKDRPEEVEDRVIPGHWEGDLITGSKNKSAFVTLVERTTRFTLIVQTGADHTAATVRRCLEEKLTALPAELVKSLTWDQGSEMAEHVKFRVATEIDVFFADPHSPWQRGTNENTNGLIRQYFPKGTDLSVHTQDHLDHIAAKLNDRPRKTLGYMKPSEKFAELMR